MDATIRQKTCQCISKLMESELDCAVCKQPFIKATVIDCGHTFCHFCIAAWSAKKGSSPQCPICRKVFVNKISNITVDNYIDKLFCSVTEEMRAERAKNVEERFGQKYNATTPATSDGNNNNLYLSISTQWPEVVNDVFSISIIVYSSLVLKFCVMVLYVLLLFKCYKFADKEVVLTPNSQITLELALLAIKFTFIGFLVAYFYDLKFRDHEIETVWMETQPTRSNSISVALREVWIRVNNTFSIWKLFSLYNAGVTMLIVMVYCRMSLTALLNNTTTCLM